MKRVLFSATVAAVALVPLFAEISPVYYREMQQQAPEQLKIRVVSVSRDWFFWRSERKTMVHANVTAVVKSASGIAAGNTVYFEYMVFTPPRGGWTGPRPMPVLEQGSEYDFFGEKVNVTKDKGIVLNPTARGYSFESLLETP